jgi:hypothetical protein
MGGNALLTQDFGSIKNNPASVHCHSVGNLFQCSRVNQEKDKRIHVLPGTASSSAKFRTCRWKHLMRESSKTRKTRQEPCELGAAFEFKNAFQDFEDMPVEFQP